MIRLLRFAVEHYLVVPLGVVVALIWANTAPESYYQVAEALWFIVNDIGMAFALAFLMQEVVEAMLPGGTLHPWHRAALPIVAAVGGTLGAIAMYQTVVSAADEPVLALGWPIASAVDIAVGFLVARSIFGRHAAVTFLLLLAIATDAIGLVLVSQRYPVGDAVPGRGRADRPRHRSRHRPATLQGPSRLAIRLDLRDAVLVRVLLERRASRAGAAAGRTVSAAQRARPESGDRSGTRPPSDGCALRVRVQVSGAGRGVPLRSREWRCVDARLRRRHLGSACRCARGSAPRHPRGRRAGARGGSSAATPPRLARLVVIAFAASSGFTFAVFFATAVFPVGPTLTQTKIGALATLRATLLALAAARLLRVGRFAVQSSLLVLAALILPGCRAHPLPVADPLEVRPHNGVAELTLTAAADARGRDTWFFNGQAIQPAIRLSPGDVLKIHYVNALPATPREPCAADPCMNMTNLHFHGLSVSPQKPPGRRAGPDGHAG